MGLGDVFSSILGGNAGKDEMQKSLQISRDNVELLKNLNVPTEEAQRIVLQNPELAGLLGAETIDGTALNYVSVDPRLQQARNKALEQMGALSQQGLGAEDKAAFNQLRRQTAGAVQANQQQVLSNAAARGTLNSGNTLTAQLMAGQNAANNMSQQSDQIAAQAAAARRQALGQYSDMSTNMANNDFSQRAQIANAKDTINQFNSQTKTNANQYNLTNQQNIANQRASNANQQEIYNKQLKQQKFQNDLSKINGVSGANQNLANTYATQGTNAANGQAAMTGALIGGAASIGSAAVKKPGV